MPNADGLAAVVGALWVKTDDGRRVSVADPVTGRVTSYPLGDKSLQLAAAGDRVVATSAAGGSVTVLDSATGQRTGQVALPEARLVVIAGQDIWVDARDGLTRIGPDLAAVADRELGTGANGDLVATAAGGRALAARERRLVTRQVPRATVRGDFGPEGSRK